MRIRTIKPDFWTDEIIGELSITSRLLFIALWNVADDQGNLMCSLKQLKIQTFPYDDIDITFYLHELIKHQLIIPYVVDNKSFFHIKNFLKHQKINRPSPAIYPIFSEYSVNNHILFNDNSLGKEGSKGKERKGKERKEEEEEEEEITFDFVNKIFDSQNMHGAKEFYEKMKLLNWKASDGNSIKNLTSYILQSIDKLKKHENIKPTHEQFASKSITTSEKQLTGAELRKLKKQST
jgi:hypothetical protein